MATSVNPARYEFKEFNTVALFDPQVDYMYVNQIEFDSLMQPTLKKIYGDALNCNANDCHFKTVCSNVKKEGLGLSFLLTQYDHTHNVAIEVLIENYLIDGPQIGEDKNSCYLPIFVADPRSHVDVFGMWFLGNMFLDRYLVMNDMVGAGDIGSKYHPRVGIFDKYMHAAQSE